MRYPSSLTDPSEAESSQALSHMIIHIIVCQFAALIRACNDLTDSYRSIACNDLTDSYRSTSCLPGLTVLSGSPQIVG